METFKFKEEFEHSLNIKPTANSDVFAWRVKTHRILNNGSREDTKLEKQGLTLKKDIDKLKSGDFSVRALVKHKEKYNNILHEWSSEWVLIPQSSLTEAAKWGFSGKKGEYKWLNKISKKPYSDLDTHILIRLSSYDHHIFDSKNQPLPVALYCDYLSNGAYHNGKYDLNKAYIILSKRKDVHSLSEPEEIRPYQNQRKFHTKGLSFIYAPDVKTYIKMQEKIKEINNKQYHTDANGQAIFELDLLGLRKGGAALYDTFYESREYDKKYENIKDSNYYEDDDYYD